VAEADAEPQETDMRGDETMTTRGIRSVAACTALAATAALACASLGWRHEGKRPVARVGETEITQAELDEALRGQLVKLELDYKQSVYRNQKNVLNHLIESQLVAEEAERRGMALKELYEVEIKSPGEEIPEEEIREVYGQYEGKTDKTYEEMRDPIREYLVREKRSALEQELVKRLRAEAEIEILLPYPELPVIEVAGGGAGPSKGPADAPVTIVEFADFQCPYCSRMQPTLNRLLEDYPDQVRLVYRHFPLSSHPLGQAAAEASACADEQGRFWPYHDLIFEDQAELSEDKLFEFAAAAGLDVDAFRVCTEDRRFAQLVKDDFNAGREAGVSGTPSFFVNGRPVYGAGTEQTFRELIERELAR
jgi:protein-disulfide isomerase